MSNGNGHHWSKFCWRDHLGDAALRDCSLAARGFWIGLLGLMHEGVPVGHLTIYGLPATLRQMASNLHCTEREAKKALAELEAANVFSRTEGGTIYSRRMVKDTQAAEAAKAWGKTGGNPTLKARPNGSSADPPTAQGVNPPLNPQGYRPPKPPGLTPPLSHGVNPSPPLPPDPSPQTQNQREREERKEESKLFLSSSVLARVEAACEKPAAGTYGGEPEPEPVSNALQFAAKNIAGKLGRKLESSGKFAPGKRAQRTPIEQIDTVLHGEVLEDERQEPLHRGPVEPQRTVAEQLAALGFPNGVPPAAPRLAVVP